MEEKTVTPDVVGEFLGPEIFVPDAAERTELPGIATGKGLDCRRW